MMILSLRVEAHVNCPVCAKSLLGEAADDARIEAALFGISEDPYATCPQCKRETPETRADPEFRRRVRVYLFEHEARVVREDPVPDALCQSG